MKMCFLRVASLLAAVAFGVTVYADSPLYFDAVPNEPNELRAQTGVAVPTGEATSDGESDNSGWQTTEAAAESAFTSEYGQAVATASTAVGPYGSNRMSFAGLAEVSITDFGVELPSTSGNTSLEKKHVGIISSDTQPIGTPVNVSVTILVYWNNASGGTFNTAGNYSVAVQGAGSAGFMLTDGSILEEMDQYDLDPDGDSYETTANFQATVGDKVTINVDSNSLLTGPGFGGSSLGYEVIVDVNFP